MTTQPPAQHGGGEVRAPTSTWVGQCSGQPAPPTRTPDDAPSSTPKTTRATTARGTDFLDTVDTAPETMAQTLRRNVDRMAAESTLASGASTPAVRVVTHTCATRHEQINTLLLAGH